ncbi:hypothetical protein B0H11DRAFT_2352784 [Mycena galericulata]|nr:hypothetical protein B0H11DRAFT_2352784 [Mycena galericulata]
MPIPTVAKSSNASFHPSYVPVAIFVGGTSGVGQGMVEAFARYVHGRAHIIVVGRNEHAAAEITARLPKPPAGEASGWTHEFIPCDVSLMANVRTACVLIGAKVERINFLVLTAGYNSMVNFAITSEGLDLLLAMRYYYRFAMGQDAKVMSVLGAGRGSPKRPIDLDNLGNNVKARTGRIRVALRSMIVSADYTDAMLAHFAAGNPAIAFTHIHPEVVQTSALRVDFDGLLTPLSWLINWILPFLSVSQVILPYGDYWLGSRAHLYALFTGERGLYIRDRYGNVLSSLAFDAPVELGNSDRTSVLNGIPMPGYGASDLGVRRVVEHT